MSNFKKVLLIFISIWILMLILYIGIDVSFNVPIEWYKNIVLSGLVSIFNTVSISLTLKE